MRYIEAVDRLRSFSAAAKELGISQPSVSNAIAAFETEIGVTLFDRTTRGVEPTVSGRVIIESIRSVLQSTSRLEKCVQVMHEPERKTLRLAFSPAVESNIVLGLAAQYSRSLPDVELVFKECTVDDLEERVGNQTVDVIFAPRNVAREHWKCCKLYSDTLRYVPSGAWTNGASSVSLREIAQRRIVLTKPICGLAQAIKGLFEQAGLALDEYPGKAISYSVLLEWAALGLGGAILPELKLGADAHKYPVLTDGVRPIQLTYSAMWHPSHLVASHVGEFVSMIARGSARNLELLSTSISSTGGAPARRQLG
jgi:DNA-binding transcriptional LysR family regulator